MREQQEQLTMLAEVFRSGNDRVFTDIYEMTQRDLYVYALMLMKDPDKAQDLLQDTYIKIYEQVHTLRDPARFLPWAKTIEYNLAMAEFRKRGRAPILLDEDKEGLFDMQVEEADEFIPEERLDKQELQEIVFDVVKTLPMEQRVAMVAYYYDEMSVKDIAQMMDCSEGTVKSRLFNGRKAFKEKVEAYERKHDLKLHSVSPLLFFGFKGFDLATAPTANAAARTLAHVVASTGIETAGHGIGVAGVHAGAGGVKTVAAAGSAAGKKIAAGLIVAALALGGGGYAVYHNAQGDDASEVKQEESIATEATTAEGRAMQAYKKYLEDNVNTIKGFEIVQIGADVPTLVFSEETSTGAASSVKVYQYYDDERMAKLEGTLESVSSNEQICYHNGKLYAVGYLNGQDISEYYMEDGELVANGYYRQAGAGVREISYRGPMKADAKTELKGQVVQGRSTGESGERTLENLKSEYIDSLLELRPNNETNRNALTE